MRTSTINHLVPVGLASAALAAPALANPIVATTARGAFIHVLTDFPVGVGPFPTIILASGQSYHMTMPALDQTAKQMVAQDIAVYRFNWAYFSEDAKLGLPSDKALNGPAQDAALMRNVDLVARISAHFVSEKFGN